MDNEKKIAVLIVDDSTEDKEAVRRYLSKSLDNSYLLIEADTGEEGLDILKEKNPDCVLLDFQLPDMDGIDFIRDVIVKSDLKKVPVIMLTGQGDESIAVESLKSGVQDYLVKETLTSDLLLRSIKYAIDKKQSELEQEKYIKDIECALERIKKLEGLLPICSSCKMIRDEKGYWNHIEKYICDHSEAKFTHGICPECAKELYPDVMDDLRSDPDLGV